MCSFATGCKQPECLVPFLDGLSEWEIKEVQRWVEVLASTREYPVVPPERALVL